MVTSHFLLASFSSSQGDESIWYPSLLWIMFQVFVTVAFLVQMVWSLLPRTMQASFPRIGHNCKNKIWREATRASMEPHVVRKKFTFYLVAQSASIYCFHLKAQENYFSSRYPIFISAREKKKWMKKSIFFLCKDTYKTLLTSH